MRILISGAGGYVGSVLVPHLISFGHQVVAYDTFWFGDHLHMMPKGAPWKYQADIRDIDRFKHAVRGCDAVIHMACISNDASFELDERLSTEINYAAFEPLVIASKEAGVSRFIYCSSSSVYGVSDLPEITEAHPLVPLTLYNKYKGLCEPLLFKHATDDFICTVLRPATICGYSPRMRFDLTVNIFVKQAMTTGEIKIFGGEQTRPNLHIQDMVDCYTKILMSDTDLIAGEVFNVGYANMSIKDIAMIVKDEIEQSDRYRRDCFGSPVTILVEESIDKRSYRINSDKIKNIVGFEPRYDIRAAIREIIRTIRLGEITDTNYYNVKHLKALGIK